MAISSTNEIQNQGAKAGKPTAGQTPNSRLFPLSFIRTITVGFGFTPNLLTFLLTINHQQKALAG